MICDIVTWDGSLQIWHEPLTGRLFCVTASSTWTKQHKHSSLSDVPDETRETFSRLLEKTINEKGFEITEEDGHMYAKKVRPPVRIGMTIKQANELLTRMGLEFYLIIK